MMIPAVGQRSTMPYVLSLDPRPLSGVQTTMSSAFVAEWDSLHVTFNSQFVMESHELDRVARRRGRNFWSSL